MRYVKLMADFGCDIPLWTITGSLMEAEHIPLSEHLWERLDRWLRWYNRRVHDAPIVNEQDFHTEGRDLAESIKRELPEWTVVYFDEEKLEALWDAENERYVSNDTALYEKIIRLDDE